MGNTTKTNTGGEDYCIFHWPWTGQVE